MHFDSRTQAALREVGLTTDEIETASDLVAEQVADDAAAIESFFGDGGTYYSDMELAHAGDGLAEHEVVSVSLYTHAADLRGYVEFENWGVPVEGGRILSEDVVELSLGPTVHDRVRFAADPEAL